VSLTKSSIQITIISIVSVVVGLLQQLVIAFIFGTKFSRDAYLMALAVPNYVSLVLVGSLGCIFLPTIVSIRNRCNESYSQRVLGSMFTLTALVSLLIIAVLAIFSNRICVTFYGDLGVDKTYEVSYMMRILSFTIFFTIINSFLSSLYQIDNNFIRPALATTLSLVFNTLFILLFNKKLDAYSLPYGYLCGLITATVFQIGIAVRNKIRIIFDFSNDEFKHFVLLFLPLLVSGIFCRSTTLIERNFASRLGEGAVSYLGYSSYIISSIANVIIGGIAISSYPVLSTYWVKGYKSDFSNLLSKILKDILIIIIPICIFIIFFSNEVITLLLKRGAFDTVSTVNTSKVLICSIGALIAQAMAAVIAKVLYIADKTKESSIISIIEVLLYFFLGLVLIDRISFLGLGIALSVSSLFNVTVTYWFINRKLVHISAKEIFNSALKISICTLIFTFFNRCLFLFISEYVNFFLSIFFIMFLEVIFFVISCYICKIEEFTKVFKKIIYGKIFQE